MNLIIIWSNGEKSCLEFRDKEEAENLFKELHLQKGFTADTFKRNSFFNLTHAREVYLEY